MRYNQTPYPRSAVAVLIALITNILLRLKMTRTLLVLHLMVSWGLIFFLNLFLFVVVVFF